VLWGATVITNLLSAIPWLGKSLVESNKIIKYKSKPIVPLLFYSSVTPGRAQGARPGGNE